MESSAIQNRLQKNLKKLKTYIHKSELEAFRVYSKDIPEYPYLIDIYGNEAVIYEQGKKLSIEEDQIREKHQKEIATAITTVFAIPESKQHFKIRERQKGTEQYRPLDKSSRDYFIVKEPPFKFWVNLDRYLDTGLFLDHRPLRYHLFQHTKEQKVLNLFCYTGSISVACALGGAIVTSVDMSRTYLDWAVENFILNDIDPKAHRFLQSDVLKELKNLEEKKESFDTIILDPPSFSNSKRMEEDLDIERDHPILVRDSMKLLKPEGTLYFSTNKRKFELHRIITEQYEVREISQWTVPQDFHHTGIHRAFTIRKKL